MVAVSEGRGPVDFTSRRFRRYHAMIKRTYVKQDGTIGHLWQSESAVTVDEHHKPVLLECGSRTQPV
jgi:hypothetical protein